MAVKGQEVEGIKGGIEAASAVKGSFNQNMLFRRMSVETRDGFGQVAELDTTMNAIEWDDVPGITTPDASKLWGYKNHLGSYLINTSFGHEQLVSVFSASVLTGDRQFEPVSTTAGTSPSAISEFLSIYVISIYDLSSGQRWEEPVYEHTSSLSEDGPLEMPFWHGNYESSYTQQYGYSTTVQGAWFGGRYSIRADRQRWIKAPEPDEPFFFVELDDILYMGNKHTGLLAYIPSKFRGRWIGGRDAGNNSGTMRRDRSRQANTVLFDTAKPIYSESSVVIDAVAVDGPFSAGFTYLNQSEFPKPIGGASIEGRLAVFEGNNVYFSDVSYPTSIVADNVLFVPSEEPVTAIAEHTGNLLIFTENEVWYFRPAQGFLITQGSLIKLSSGVGCVSQNAVVSAAGSIFWMDKRACYTMGGSISISKVSEEIEPFFNDFITNPITSYYTLNGNVPLMADMGDQASMRMAFNPAMMSAVYSHKLECILFCMPHLGGALCLAAAGEWGWWSFESNVVQTYDRVTDTFSNAVGVAKNIRNAWILSTTDDLFLISSYNSSESGELVNQLPLAPTGDTTFTTSRPYSILQYGRGGSVDRSYEYGEDRRLLSGNWKAVDEGDSAFATPANSDHYIYFGKPIPIPYKTQIGAPGSTLGYPAPLGSHWLPIGIVPGRRDLANNSVEFPVYSINIAFTYDLTHWETIPAGSGTQASPPLYFLPPERQAAQALWTVAKGPDNTVTASWLGAAATTNVEAYGVSVMNLNKRQYNRLLYIPFRPILDGGQFKAYQGLNIAVTVKQVGGLNGALPGGLTTATCRAYVWEESFLGEAEKGDNHQAVYTGVDTTPDRVLVAQPVDWAYKTRPVADEGKVQIKGRGLRITGISRGAATRRLTEGWPMGILNTLSGADYKEWSSQVVDIIPQGDAANTLGEHPAVISSAYKQTLRTRFKRASTGSLVYNTFDQVAGPEWGTPGGTATSYSYITDEEETSLLDVSDGIRGQSVSYMLWGHIQNKAEKIILHSAKIILRVLGGTRRKGR